MNKSIFKCVETNKHNKPYVNHITHSLFENISTLTVHKNYIVKYLQIWYLHTFGAV